MKWISTNKGSLFKVGVCTFASASACLEGSGGNKLPVFSGIVIHKDQPVSELECTADILKKGSIQNQAQQRRHHSPYLTVLGIRNLSSFIHMTILVLAFINPSRGESNDPVIDFVVTNEVNRFISINQGSEVHKELLTKELHKFLALHGSELGGFPDHALDTMGDIEIHALLRKFFSNPNNNVQLLDSHIKNYLVDMDSEDQFFKNMVSRLGVFILTQYIPLTYSQRQTILADPDKFFPHAKPGRLLRFAFELSSQHISSVLPLFLNEAVNHQLNEHQKDFVHFLGSRVFRSAFDIFLPIERDTKLSQTLFRWRPLDLYVESNSDSPSTLYTQILDKYFYTQSQSWRDEYNLSEADFDKLCSAAYISMQQYLKKYPTIADIVHANSKVRRHQWMFISITHEMTAQPTWQKLVNKISKTQSHNSLSDELQPISDLLDYYKLCSQLNISFWILASRCGSFDGLFSGYQSGVTELNFLSGLVINKLSREIHAAVNELDQPVDFPDFSHLMSLKHQCGPVLEKLLSQTQKNSLIQLTEKFE